MAGIVYVAANVRAEANPGVMRGPHFEHGRSMHDFVGYSLHKLLRHPKDLGLSEEQSERIKAIAAEYVKNRIQRKADIELAELNAQTRLFDEKAELADIETALRRSEAARTALRLEGVKALRAASAILTPEQREKWRQNRMERHGTTRRGAEYRDEPDETSHPQPGGEG
jgi:Spy/CpxP family protein refolding chaperone